MRRDRFRHCAARNPASEQPGGHAADRATPPELLVGLGFRGWVAGYQSGELHSWEAVWRLHTDALGARAAQTAVGELAEWAKCVARASAQGIRVRPFHACGFCRDECLAISMVAAQQHDACPALKACAFALIESAALDDVLARTSAYAATLAELDRVVSPAWIVNANAYLDTAAARAN